MALLTYEATRSGLNREVEIDLYHTRRVAIGIRVCPSLHVAVASRYVRPYEGDAVLALRGSSISVEGWLDHGVDSGTTACRRAERHVSSRMHRRI